MIRIAIIGLGHIGRVHAATLHRTTSLDLVACCDHDASSAKELPAGLPFFDSPAALLAAGGFDTVVVATPNCTHHAIAREVIEAGYDVIVEKPACSSLAEFDALQRLASTQGHHVYYAFHAALAPEVEALVAHLRESGEMYGELTAFSSRFYDPYIDAQGRLAPHAHSLDECWSDSGVNALSVLDRLHPVDGLQLAWRRQSGHAAMAPGVLSVSTAYRFGAVAGHPADGVGFGLIDTAWDQRINYKSTTLYFGQSGWRLEANHSDQTLTRWDPQGDPTELARFDGDRLVNHYLGVFTDYRDRVKAGSPMNGSAARCIHAKLYEGMPQP